MLRERGEVGMESQVSKDLLYNMSQKGRNQTPKNYFTIQICRSKSGQLHMDLRGLIASQSRQSYDVGSGWDHIVIWENNVEMKT